jgi:hypothetical protein
MAKQSTSKSVGNTLVVARGVLSLYEFYRLDEAKMRLGWTQAAYRAARRRGLRVLTSGKRTFLTGEEILRFLVSDSSRALSHKGDVSSDRPE